MASCSAEGTAPQAIGMSTGERGTVSSCWCNQQVQLQLTIQVLENGSLPGSTW